jgi:hypothetical protein
VFCYPWHAAAVAKIWRRLKSGACPSPILILMSVATPDAIYDFADAFRRGQIVGRTRPK